MSKKNKIKKPEQKKNNHIVSKMILKGFENDKKDVLQTIINISDRYVTHPNQIGGKTCFKIIKKDIKNQNDYIVRSENIQKIDAPNFCEDYMYSFDYEQYHKDLKKMKVKEKINRSKKSIIDTLEDSHGVIEQYFSYALKSLLNDGNDYNLFRHGPHIAKFLRSNELRPKLFFDESKKYELEHSSVIYTNFFDRIKMLHWLDFIKEKTDTLLNNSDFYEKMETIDFLKKHNLVKINKTRTRYLSFINNMAENNESFSNILFIINKTNLDFLLSDNIASVYYDNYIYFNDILDLIGINRNHIKLKKINITVVSPKIAIILFNEELEDEFVYINDESIIKKYNSLFFENTNEWMVVKDVSKLKDEIMDIDFSKKIKNINRLSNMLDWLKNSMNLEVVNNIEFGFKTINKQYMSFLTYLDKTIHVTAGFYKNIASNFPNNKVLYFCYEDQYNRKTNYINFSNKKENLSFYISHDEVIFTIIEKSDILNDGYNFYNQYKFESVIKYYEKIYPEYEIIIYISCNKIILSLKK